MKSLSILQKKIMEVFISAGFSQKKLLFSLAIGFAISATQPGIAAESLPIVPSDASHPGSRSYVANDILEKTVTCSGRKGTSIEPKGSFTDLPVIVYGHGQAMTIENDRATLQHLAKKGNLIIYPAYDTGFFDQNWQRMASDYVQQVDCVIQQNTSASRQKIIYSGYSKGAYVGSIAIGLAFSKGAQFKPSVGWFFSPAGVDTNALKSLPVDFSMNVVKAEEDKTVKPLIAEQIYSASQVSHKQLITLMSYRSTIPALTADHFWTLSKASAFGGAGESAFHYYGLWKWLGGAAEDLKNGARFNNDFAYGNKALEKGISGLSDQRLTP